MVEDITNRYDIIHKPNIMESIKSQSLTNRNKYNRLSINCATEMVNGNSNNHHSNDSDEEIDNLIHKVEHNKELENKFIDAILYSDNLKEAIISKICVDPHLSTTVTAKNPVNNLIFRSSNTVLDSQHSSSSESDDEESDNKTALAIPNTNTMAVHDPDSQFYFTSSIIENELEKQLNALTIQQEKLDLTLLKAQIETKSLLDLEGKPALSSIYSNNKSNLNNINALQRELRSEFDRNVCRLSHLTPDIFTELWDEDMKYLQKVSEARAYIPSSSSFLDFATLKFIPRYTTPSKQTKSIGQIGSNHATFHVIGSNKSAADSHGAYPLPQSSDMSSSILINPPFYFPPLETYPELKPVDQKRIQTLLYTGTHTTILSQAFNISIKRSDLQTLDHINWLNDEIINFYLNMIVERSEKALVTSGILDSTKSSNCLEKEYNQPKIIYPSCFAFNTFFYSSLSAKGYASVRRWTKKVDIFTKDMIFVPVHIGAHWCMAIIDLRHKVIIYFDSLYTEPHETYLNTLLYYLEEEHWDKKKEKFDASEWQLINAQNVPQQHNGSDCGVFALKYAEFLSRLEKFTFSQNNMPYFRQRMILEIVDRRFYNQTIDE